MIKKKKSLQRKFVLIFNTVSLLLLLFVLIGSMLLSNQAFWSASEESVALCALLSQKDVAAFFDDVEQNLENAAHVLSGAHFESRAEAERLLQDLSYSISGKAVLYMAFADGSAYSADGWIPDEDYDSREDSWYTNGLKSHEIVYSETQVDTADTGEIILTLSHVILGDDGKTLGVAAMDVYTQTIVDFCMNLQILDTTGHAFLLDNKNNVIAHQNDAYLPTISGDNVKFTSFDGIVQKTIKTYDAITVPDASPILKRVVDYDHKDTYLATLPIPGCDWIFGISVPREDFYAKQTQSLLGTLILLILSLPLSIVIFTLITRYLLNPIFVILKAAKRLAVGDAQVDVEYTSEDELGQLAEDFREMIHSTQEQVAAMQRMAGGDFTMTVTKKSPEDALSDAINHLISNLRDLIVNIAATSDQVAVGSRQIAQGSQELAHGATEQASSIESFSLSISDVSLKTQDNAQKAEHAAVLANQIMQNANMGSQQMDSMLTAVRDIGQASQSISKVIKVIDEIAFQTNILALNASVEAAHAGQNGKGFAVVAEEVRSLAAKSTEAAKDTSALIDDSIQKAQLGAKIAMETAASLKSIVEGINQSNEIVGEIAQSSQEQLEAIRQINSGMDVIAQVISQNSATSQQSAAASGEMNHQSEILRELISQFQVGMEQDAMPMRIQLR